MPSFTITVANTHATRSLKQFRTVAYTLDHAALVTKKISRADGRDIRIVHGTFGELVVHVQDPNTTSTRVYFAIVTLIAPSGSDALYTMIYGDLSRPDPTPIGARDKSFIDPATGDLASPRTQPFIVFDDFKHKYTSPNWVAYADSDPLDPDLWTVRSGASYLVRIVGGIARLRATLGQSVPDWAEATIFNGGDNRTRVRFQIDGTPSSFAGGGFLRRTAASTLTCYSAELGATAAAGRTREWAADTPADLATGTLPGGTATGRKVEAWIGALGTEIQGNVDGLALSTTDATLTTGGHGVMSIAGGTGTFDVFTFMAEEWDGVPDGNVSVTGTPPQLGIPACVGFPITEAIVYPLAVNAFPEHLSVRRQRLGQFDVGGYELRFGAMAPEDYYELIAFYAEQGGGVGLFSFAPPGESSSFFRFRPDSLVTTKESFSHFRAEVALEKLKA